jgi:hypothetical protein
MNASCQCGAITFITPLPTPLKIYICHCLDCRHQSSSAFGVSVMFPNFELPSGPEIPLRSFSVRTPRREAMICYFCGNCGSRLAHGGKEQKYVSVKGGCLGEGLTKEMLWKAVHIWTSRAVVDVPQDVVSYEEDPPGEPGMELEG